MAPRWATSGVPAGGSGPLRVSSARPGSSAMNPESAANAPLMSTSTCESELWYTQIFPFAPMGTTEALAMVWSGTKLRLLTIGMVPPHG